MSPISFIGASVVFVHFLFHFSIKFFQTNRIAPDGTPHNILGYSLCQRPIKGHQAYIGLSEDRRPELSLDASYASWQSLPVIKDH